MLITEHHVIPCQPKTRSSLRRELLAPLLGAVKDAEHEGRHYGGHIPAHAIPRALVGSRVFVAVVRDPVEWYRSLYRHCISSALQGKPLRAFEAWGQGFTDWRSVVYGWTHPAEVEPPTWHDGLYSPGHPVDYFGRGGLWSWSTRYHLGRGLTLELPAIVQCERMGEGLEAVGVCPASLVDGLPPVNVSRHNADRVTPVDDEIRRWVWVADGHLATRCGYKEAP